MTALNKQALREAAEKATQGEWWSDVVETDGEYGEGEDRASGYHSYAVYVGSESLLDMTNSTTACIHEEWDHDYHMAWDETAKRNAEFIAAANPATVLALLDELEAAEKRIAELEAREVKLPAACADDEYFIDGVFQALRYERDVERAIRAAGIGVKGELQGGKCE
ncbi:TPA: ead/Ea22-like family protein [Citrobacter freundii]